MASSWGWGFVEEFQTGLLQTELTMEKENESSQTFISKVRACFAVEITGMSDYIVGWSKKYKTPKTRVAQVYPKRLCLWLATAMLIDSGLLPERKKLDVSAAARAQHKRRGEAKTPGPRRKKSTVRSASTLDEVLLVETSTEELGFRVWQWGQSHLDVETFESLSGCLFTLPLLLHLLDAVMSAR